jgi:diguanylate cyclase (GGDEF)-like protein/PAS domain S-box-containing protein
MHEKVRPERLLAALLSSSDEAILTFALDGTIQTWSHGAEKLYGYSAAEIIARPLAQLFHRHEAPNYEGLIHAAISGEFPHSETADRKHKDGTILRVSVRHMPIRNDRGEIVEILESGSAFSSGLSPTSSADPLCPLLEQLPMILWTTDRDLRITFHGGAGLPGVKWKPGELIGRSVQEYLKYQDHYTTPLAQHYEALQGSAVHFEYKRNNRILELHLEPLRSPSGDIIGCIGAGLDISERKKSEEKIRHAATHDALTGLANYREFLDSLEREVRRSERNNRSFAVLLLDLDGLKRINDRQGHLAGNRALKRLSDVMKEQCRSTDLAARYGGDEFAVLLVDSDPGMARRIASRVQSALRNSKEDPPLTVSIGVSIYPDNGRTAQDLLEAADKELYQSKRNSRARGVAVR